MNSIIYDIIKKNNINQFYNSTGTCTGPKENIGYKSKTANTLFWGMYRIEDINLCLDHEGKGWIYWHYNDCNPNYDYRKSVVNKLKNLKNMVHLCNNDSAKFLNYYKIKYISICDSYNERCCFDKQIQDSDVIQDSDDIIEKDIVSLKYYSPIKCDLEYIIVYGSYLFYNNMNIIIASTRYNKATWTTQYSSENTAIFKYDNEIKKINEFHINTLSHNMVFICLPNKNQILGIGGVSSKSHASGKYNEGVYIIELDFSNNKIKTTEPKLLISKSMSIRQNYSTAFDNQCSLAYCSNTKNYYLYTRYNKNSRQRYCQVFISKNYDSYNKKSKLVTINNNENIFIYHGYIYYENDKFIGFFRYYLNKDDVYDNKYLLSESLNGINFKVKHWDIFNILPDKKFYILNHGHKTSGDNKHYYLSHPNKGNNQILEIILDKSYNIIATKEYNDTN